jgi:hypothetical protein
MRVHAVRELTSPSRTDSSGRWCPLDQGARAEALERSLIELQTGAVTGEP